MEMLLVIASNNKCWDKDEWDALFNRALEIHLSKAQKTKIDNECEPPSKIGKISQNVEESDFNQDDNDDDNNHDDNDSDTKESDTKNLSKKNNDLSTDC